MSEVRKKLIKLAFAKMDRTGDGLVTIDDLADCYNVRKHVKFINGEKTQRQILLEFLQNFEAADSIDGKVRNYFVTLSTLIAHE